MPLPVAHGILGASLVAALWPRTALDRIYQPVLIGVLLANAADFDFGLVYAFGSKTWHRGFTHSIVFALIVFLICVLVVGKKRIQAASAYGLAFASHAVLDYITTKEGSGVELLWPFSRERLILGWWSLSEVPSKLTNAEILQSLALEFVLFTPFLLVSLAVRRIGGKPRVIC